MKYEALEVHQNKYNKDSDTWKNHPVFYTRSAVAVQWEDGAMNTWSHSRVQWE